MNLYKAFKNIRLNACLPRICGLTATIVNKKCKKDEFYAQMKKLESNMESKVVTACVLDDTGDGNQFVFKPKIEIINFELKPAINNDISIRLDNYTSKLREFSDYFKQNDIEEKSCVAEFSRYFRDLSETINEIGSYGFYLKHKSSQEYLNGQVTTLNLSNASTDKQFGLIFSLMLQDLDELCESYAFEDLFQHDSNKILYLSSKIRELLGILKQQFELNNKFSAIIFVQKRNTAGIVDLVLKGISEIDEWSFIKSGFIVGHNVSGSKSRQTSMEPNEQVF
jgi:ERCC4-related helicase